MWDHNIGSVAQEALWMADYFVKASQGEEFWTDERCFITELCNSGRSPNSSLAVARVEPGITTQLHALAGVTETYIVIDGEGDMEVAGEKFPITSGDQVVIPPGVSQRVTSTGNADLRFYCLCTPRFSTDSYKNLE